MLTIAKLYCDLAGKKSVYFLQNNCYNKDVPATLRVLFAVGNPSAVVPLHCTTVPFSLAVAVNVRVEVISARVVLITTLGLAVFVRVATKLKSSHCTAATLLQFRLLSVAVVLVNWIRALVGKNGSTIHSRRNPWLTVQV